MAWDRIAAGSLVLGALFWASPPPVAPEPRPEAAGVVVSLDAPKGSVTLDHGPIRGVMPAMRMAFRVVRPDLLAALQPGDTVRFTLESRGPEWLIVEIERAEKASAAGARASFPAPDFALRRLDGAILTLSAQRGKTVLLNFWATWCVPCRTEMAAIERLYQRYKDNGLEVFAINLDVLSTAGVDAFVKEVTLTFPILLDPEWSTARAYRVLGLPTTYLIDPTGHVVVRETGARDWDDALTHAAVAKLLERRSQ